LVIPSLFFGARGGGACTILSARTHKYWVPATWHQRPLEHAACESRLGRKSNQRLNARRPVRRRVISPRLRQIIFAGDGSTASMARVTGEHVDLTAFDATVLAPSTDRMSVLPYRLDQQRHYGFGNSVR
jgi:hypothetical protein